MNREEMKAAFDLLAERDYIRIAYADTKSRVKGTGWRPTSPQCRFTLRDADSDALIDQYLKALDERLTEVHGELSDLGYTGEE